MRRPSSSSRERGRRSRGGSFDERDDDWRSEGSRASRRPASADRGRAPDQRAREESERAYKQWVARKSYQDHAAELLWKLSRTRVDDDEEWLEVGVSLAAADRLASLAGGLLDDELGLVDRRHSRSRPPRADAGKKEDKKRKRKELRTHPARARAPFPPRAHAPRSSPSARAQTRCGSTGSASTSAGWRTCACRRAWRRS